jgi:hypothetical protein
LDRSFASVCLVIQNETAVAPAVSFFITPKFFSVGYFRNFSDFSQTKLAPSLSE